MIYCVLVIDISLTWAKAFFCLHPSFSQRTNFFFALRLVKWKRFHKNKIERQKSDQWKSMECFMWQWCIIYILSSRSCVKTYERSAQLSPWLFCNKSFEWAIGFTTASTKATLSLMLTFGKAKSDVIFGRKSSMREGRGEPSMVS